jgi:hypothetical protein
MTAAGSGASLLIAAVNRWALLLPEHVLGEWTPAHSLVFLLSLFGWAAVFLCAHAVSLRLFATYGALSGALRIEWLSRLVSTCHAVWQVCGALSIALSLDRFDFLAYSAVADFYFLSLAAYLSFDAVLVCATPHLRSAGTVAHHFAGCASALAVVASRIGCAFLALFLFTEASTPFVNLHWFLRTSGESDALLLANGVLMWLSFVAFRVCSLPFTVSLVYRHIGQIVGAHQFGWLLALFFLSQFLLLSVLNLKWALQITRGLLRALRKPKGD